MRLLPVGVALPQVAAVIGGRPTLIALAVTRLVGALLLEQNDEWATTRRYMTLETLGTVSDTTLVSLPGVGV